MQHRHPSLSISDIDATKRSDKEIASSVATDSDWRERLGGSDCQGRIESRSAAMLFRLNRPQIVHFRSESFDGLIAAQRNGLRRSPTDGQYTVGKALSEFPGFSDR